MSLSRKLGKLPPELRPLLEAVEPRQSFSSAELDHLLATLQPEVFEDQLEALLVWLDKRTLDFERTPKDTHNGGSGLPSGGRISRRYLQEVTKYPMMTREEEMAFARRMEFVAARVTAAEFATAAEQAQRQKEYLQVRRDFIERSLHLVVSEAYGYRTYGVPLDDLIQEGNAALMRAVEKFDWRHNVRFRTYVAYWIRQAIERFLAAQKGAVRVPHHLQQKHRRLKREGKLPGGLASDVTVKQVASAFEISPDLARHLLEASRPSYSLDQEVGNEGDTYRDFLVQNWELPDGDRERLLSNRMNHLMADLDDREQTVLRMRFGLEGQRTFTLEEVGKRLSLSRERSRQIQQRALRKLRRSAETHNLEEYL